MPTVNKKNLDQFVKTVRNAYQAAKQAGKIKEDQIEMYDALTACPAVVYPTNNNFGWVEPIYAHKQWRRKVATLYYKDQGRPLRGIFGWNVDWESVWNWILENIVPILKILIAIVPFLI